VSPHQAAAHPNAGQRSRQLIHPQAPAFRPILDGSGVPYVPQPTQGVPNQSIPTQATNPQFNHNQSGRRSTGPRRGFAPSSIPVVPQTQNQLPAYQQQPIPSQEQAYSAPQSYAPQSYAPQAQAQRNVQAQAQLQRGSSHPPIGQPIVQQTAPTPLYSITPEQRLAQFTAQTKSDLGTVVSQGPVALSPQEAQKSLFGSLNDDIRSGDDLPTVSSVPTQAVTQEDLGDILAGGL